MKFWAQVHDLTRPGGDVNGELARKIADLAYEFYVPVPASEFSDLQARLSRAEEALREIAEFDGLALGAPKVHPVSRWMRERAREALDASRTKE